MALKSKKIICAAVAMLCVGAFAVDAGVQPNAIGLRFIGGTLLGGEINYQRALGLFGSKRLELGASFWGDEDASTFAIAAVPQWHWNISRSVASGGFNWYAGPGIGLGLFSTKDIKDNTGTTVTPGKNEFFLGVGGQIGIEYDFNAVGVPLNLSIDSRPMIDLLHSGGISLMGIINGANLALRFTF